MGNYRDYRLWVEKGIFVETFTIIVPSNTSHESLKKRKPVHSHMIVTWFIWTNRSLADVLWLSHTNKHTLETSR